MRRRDDPPAAETFRASSACCSCRPPEISGLGALRRPSGYTPIFSLWSRQSKRVSVLDVMRRRDFQDADGAKVHVNIKLGQYALRSRDRIRSTLALLVERAGGRIECLLDGKGVAPLVHRQGGERDTAFKPTVGNRDASLCDTKARVLACTVG